jgi:hypothetical protein
VELKMSNQQREPKNPENKPEQKTDATAILSPEELRAISGGGGGPGNPLNPKNPTTPVGTIPGVVLKK